jgi:Na+/proline symporter
VSPTDWAVLGVYLAAIVAYGVWRGGRSRDMRGYLLAGREMRWGTVALSVMATQASAITFLSTPGQAYADGMRFVQFYFGLPLAMIAIAALAVPVYHRLGVFTAYEYLEGRFDLKTRVLTSALFLLQRGLAAGLTIYAPSLILSTILGWDIGITIAIIGGSVVIFTTSGGTRAVSRTHVLQAVIILAGMTAAFAALVLALPDGVGFLDAMRVAGKAGKLNAIDLSFDLNNRYTLWSGLIGGFFLQLSYFGTDQSQVQRYLTGTSVAQSRLGLLFNGLAKVPMQFAILLLGAAVFAFYQFTPPPVFFNPRALEQARAADAGGALRALEAGWADAAAARAARAGELARALDDGPPAAAAEAERRYREASARADAVRSEAIAAIRAADPASGAGDTNYVFLSFVVGHLPAGLVGLVLAAVLAASMNASSAELNALASTTVVDVYRRLIRKNADERHYVVVSRLATAGWGAFAIAFAEHAGRLGSLVEAVNILGSLFYGTILGVFLVAFLLKKVGGTAVFAAALIGEAAVLAAWATTAVSFLWYNVIGCAVVVVAALAITALRRPEPAAS